MHRRLAFPVLLVLFVSSLLAVGFSSNAVQAPNGSPVHNWQTGLNYTSIQDAIDAEETVNGHTIVVTAGIYYENVIIRKSLSLIGEHRNTTVIDANGFGHVIQVEASNVSIYGFTITESGCGCSGLSGVDITNYQNVNITHNLIIENGYGIHLENARNIIIYGNTITSNIYDGINLFNSDDNTIVGNNITHNQKRGLYLSMSQDNTIYHNSFMGNMEHVFVNQYNVWDNGYPTGGNYWSGYSDIDQYSGPYQNESGSDGIWDHPYVLDGGNLDKYPIVPEFASYLLLLPLFTIMTLFSAGVHKRDR